MRIVVIDDLRDLRPEFKVGHEIHVARDSASGMTMLNELEDVGIDVLCLDHDLGGDDTIRPVVEYLERRAFEGNPYPAEFVYVHTMNTYGAAWMMQGLRDYDALRVRAIDYFTY